jgi:uncharacterized protein (TIGR02217 family)
LDDIEVLIAFFEARQGQIFGFRWKDWSDYKSARPLAEIDFRDQVIALGDGASTQFQLIKSYRSGSNVYQRPIAKPMAGTVRLGLGQEELQEDIDFTLDASSGAVTLSYPPEEGIEVVAGFEFDVPVRFDTDRILTSVASFQAGDVPNVPVVEVRV